MAKTAKKVTQRARIRRRIRAKVSGTPVRPRLSVFRSNKHIYAQLIDDAAGVTLAAASMALRPRQPPSGPARNMPTAFATGLVAGGRPPPHPVWLRTQI